MTINTIIDWISVTVKNTEWCPDGLEKFGEPKDKGMMGYSVREDMNDGRIILSNPSRPDMGKHIIYSGETLRHIEYFHNVTAQEIVTFHDENGHRFTRIDIAVDVFGSFTAKEAIERYENKECVSPMRSANKIQSITGKGDTLYIGRRGGAKMVRIYDKAAEQKSEGVWTRCEGEFRALAAATVARQIRESSQGEKTILAIMRGIVNFKGWEAWSEVFIHGEVTLPSSRKEIGNTEKWLIEKVAPSIARFADLNPEWWPKYVRIVEELMSERKA